MLARIFVGLPAVAMISSAALADESAILVSKDGRRLSVPYASTLDVPPPPHDADLTTIFSNVGSAYPKGLYFCCYANTVSGPTSPFAQNWLALQFTPAANARVTEIDAAINYSGTGANEIVLALYSDAGGVPGNVMAQKLVQGLGSFSSCCGLAVATFAKPAPVTANTPYWVVATTSAKKGEATFAAWNYNSTDEIDPVPMANNLGSGWQSLGGFAPAPTFAVYGK